MSHTNSFIHYTLGKALPYRGKSDIYLDLVEKILDSVRYEADEGQSVSP